MKKAIIILIRLYQKTLSPDQGALKDAGLTTTPACSFYPTCSEYAIVSIEKYGIVTGAFLFLKRIIRCHPWQKNHFDPVK